MRKRLGGSPKKGCSFARYWFFVAMRLWRSKILISWILFLGKWKNKKDATLPYLWIQVIIYRLSPIVPFVNCSNLQFLTILVMSRHVEFSRRRVLFEKICPHTWESLHHATSAYYSASVRVLGTLTHLLIPLHVLLGVSHGQRTCQQCNEFARMRQPL